MNFNQVFNIVAQLLSDWRIIVAFVVVFLYLNFIFYISRYRKPLIVKRKIVKKKQVVEENTESKPEENEEQ